ncbi:UNVERIFIED_CONTAM: hypothetical protein Slati_0740100 [Sesamum latifolium]|uniref:Uncharacterized protein n=1 Tax=Sesamum latifolium TaxID=2727402 RepID=A0AAW2XIT1_9LAMI
MDRRRITPENRWEAARLKTRATRFVIQNISFTRSHIRTLCSDVCLQRKGFTFYKKYIVDAVEPTQAQGFWLTKPFGQGPFPLATGQRKFLLVAIDYFTKWVEAEPLARITEERPKNTRMVSRLAHQAKDNPQRVYWRNPFSLVYGTEAIIPAELGIPSHRVMNFSEEYNENLLRENLDLIEELRKKAFLRIQRYKNIMINSYNKRVKSQSFQVGDLVLRRVDALKPIGKLDPTWEGPYKVTSVIGKGAYELEDPEGRPLPRPWNVHNLKKYFA